LLFRERLVRLLLKFSEPLIYRTDLLSHIFLGGATGRSQQYHDRRYRD
jgi:hypothetical protein